ncbi:unnamed protein product [Cuscuta europaea]|uniref:Uncharacterized protein n=1 Tax=Cuscuta europaea TaxID=41803 RepID=A0A9P0ZU81_CUSEU|nr:unnamed protein product [Cuscuta europaea]
MRDNKWLVTEGLLDRSGSSKPGKQEGTINARDEIFGSEGQHGVITEVDAGSKEEQDIVAMEGSSGEQKRRRVWEEKEHEDDKRDNMALDFSKNEEGTGLRH